MKGKNSEYFDELHLHDLSPHYLDAYESGVQMYNDMVEKARFLLIKRQTSKITSY